MDSMPQLPGAATEESTWYILPHVIPGALQGTAHSHTPSPLHKMSLVPRVTEVCIDDRLDVLWAFSLKQRQSFFSEGSSEVETAAW